MFQIFNCLLISPQLRDIIFQFQFQFQQPVIISCVYMSPPCLHPLHTICLFLIILSFRLLLPFLHSGRGIRIICTLCVHINCTLCDRNLKFGTMIEYGLMKIIRYRAIADLSRKQNSCHCVCAVLSKEKLSKEGERERVRRGCIYSTNPLPPTLLTQHTSHCISFPFLYSTLQVNTPNQSLWLVCMCSDFGYF